MNGYCDVATMRTLLKAATEWSAAEIDSWSEEKLTAIFLKVKASIPQNIIDYYMDEAKALAVQDRISGVEDYDTYSFSQLIQIYPEIEGSSAAYLEDFLNHHHIRLLADDFAQPMKYYRTMKELLEEYPEAKKLSAEALERFLDERDIRITSEETFKPRHH